MNTSTDTLRVAAAAFLSACETMDAAMSDGLNVQGAISDLIGREDQLRALASSPQPPSSAELKAEVAPPNGLPDFGECALLIENSEFRARAAAGLEGAVLTTIHQSPEPTELHRFIYEYDDADAYRSAWFMHRLEKVVNEALASSPQQVVDPVGAASEAPNDKLLTMLMSPYHLNLVVGHDRAQLLSWGRDVWAAAMRGVNPIMRAMSLAEAGAAFDAGTEGKEVSHGTAPRSSGTALQEPVTPEGRDSVTNAPSATQATTQAEPHTVEQSITALVSALVESKGWMHGYADAIIRDAIDRVVPAQSATKAEPANWPSEVELDTVILSHRWRELSGVRAIARTVLMKWAARDVQPDTLLQDRTVYVLNASGTNRWSASVQPGQDDDGKRISDDECCAIARQLAARDAQTPPSVPSPAVKESLTVADPVDPVPLQKRCSTALRLAGSAYPRTCYECKLGPCKFFSADSQRKAAGS